jgi:hypothetical protein
MLHGGASLIAQLLDEGWWQHDTWKSQISVSNLIRSYYTETPLRATKIHTLSLLLFFSRWPFAFIGFACNGISVYSQLRLLNYNL